MYVLSGDLITGH